MLSSSSPPGTPSPTRPPRAASTTRPTCTGTSGAPSRPRRAGSRATTYKTAIARLPNVTGVDEYTSPEFPRSALLTIDMQRDFLPAVAGTAEVLPAIRQLTAAFRATGRPIVHVVRLYLPDGSNADLCR